MPRVLPMSKLLSQVRLKSRRNVKLMGEHEQTAASCWASAILPAEKSKTINVVHMIVLREAMARNELINNSNMKQILQRTLDASCSVFPRSNEIYDLWFVEMTVECWRLEAWVALLLNFLPFSIQ